MGTDDVRDAAEPVLKLVGGPGDTGTEPSVTEWLSLDVPRPSERAVQVRGFVVADCTHPSWMAHCPTDAAKPEADRRCHWWRCRKCGFTRNVKTGRAFAQPPPFDPQAVEADGDEPEAT